MQEYRFLVPVVRDSEPRQPHGEQRWTALKHGLYQLADGWTEGGMTQGAYRSRKTGKIVHDQCREFRVTIQEHDEPKLRAFARVLCDKFDQESIYLASGANVWFIDCNEKVVPDDYRLAREFLNMDGSEPIVPLSDLLGDAGWHGLELAKVVVPEINP